MALKGRGDAVRAIELQQEGFLRRTRFLDRVLWVTGENAREGYIRLHRPELMTYLSDLVEHSDVGNARRALKVSDAKRVAAQNYVRNSANYTV